MLEENLTILQMNDTHAYLDIHQELFWNGDHANYKLAGGTKYIKQFMLPVRDFLLNMVKKYTNKTYAE